MKCYPQTLKTLAYVFALVLCTFFLGVTFLSRQVWSCEHVPCEVPSALVPSDPLGWSLSISQGPSTAA